MQEHLISKKCVKTFRGLKGENIDIKGRIVAIADVFDALMNKRCYKAAWSYEKTKTYMLENSGTHFDPNLIKIFFDDINIFLKIQDENKDEI